MHNGKQSPLRTWCMRSYRRISFHPHAMKGEQRITSNNNKERCYIKHVCREASCIVIHLVLLSGLIFNHLDESIDCGIEVVRSRSVSATIISSSHLVIVLCCSQNWDAQGDRIGTIYTEDSEFAIALRSAIEIERIGGGMRCIRWRGPVKHVVGRDIYQLELEPLGQLSQMRGNFNVQLYDGVKQRCSALRNDCDKPSELSLDSSAHDNGYPVG